MRTTLVTGPTDEPIDVTEARTHLRLLDETDSPSTIEALITAAREVTEKRMGRQFLPATWELALDEFADEMELPFPPLQSVTWIQYVDDAGDTQTLDTSYYTVDTRSEPGVVRLAYGMIWPSTLLDSNAVIIRFVAGYATKDDVPSGIKHALKLLVSHFYEQRDPVLVGTISSDMPFSYKALCNSYRVPVLR